ncbi:MAG: hypothetical protein IJI24_04505 [Lachnospiraceae bacterium]|nr:hypothetical protein [Lachnospiraceae bacterium]
MKQDTQNEWISDLSQDQMEDDGRTYADMNIEGMPWYVPGDENRSPNAGKGQEKMSPREVGMYRRAALKAGFLLVLVYGGVFFLFLLFCDFIWFR